MLSSPFNSPLVTVPNAPITIDIIITFMFHSFLKNFLARSSIIIWEFFSPALAESFLQEFEWLQAPSSLQNFS